MPDAEPSQLPTSWRARAERLGASMPAGVSKAGVAAVAALVAIVAVGAWFLLRGSSPPVPVELPRAGAGPAGGAPEPGGAPAGPVAPVGPGGQSSGDVAGTITVAAAGAVARPGVYVVPSKSRVSDVINAAGGALPDADLDQVNLAAKVADADRVFVPRKGQIVPPVAATGPGGSVPGAAPPGTKDNPVDLNTATVEQLDALPGVGPAIAQAILSYRSAHGRFKSVDELLEVRGVGPAKFEALRGLVRVT